MKKSVEILQAIEENKKNLEFLPTGFSTLDKALDGGLLKKELIVIGAFTGIGKSIFGATLLYNIASKGFKTAYFSLEISNEMIVSRMVGQIANIKPTRIIAGMLTPEEFDAKAKAKAKVTMYNNEMDFYDDLYIMQDIEKAVKENNYEFLVVDFIQNIQTNDGLEEYARLSFLSIQLQKLAKEKNCCILLLSQLSNKVGREGSKIIEYKGSGAIAMVADLGFILIREEVVNGQQLIRMDLMKNRRGISGDSFHFKYIQPGGAIQELA